MTAANLPRWTKLPAEWIKDGGLKESRWSAQHGSDFQAALMAFTVVVTHAGRTRLPP